MQGNVPGELQENSERLFSSLHAISAHPRAMARYSMIAWYTSALIFWR
jgi:hypothetical protein